MALVVGGTGSGGTVDVDATTVVGVAALAASALTGVAGAGSTSIAAVDNGGAASAAAAVDLGEPRCALGGVEGSIPASAVACTSGRAGSDFGAGREGCGWTVDFAVFSLLVFLSSGWLGGKGGTASSSRGRFFLAAGGTVVDWASVVVAGRLGGSIASKAGRCATCAGGGSAEVEAVDGSRGSASGAGAGGVDAGSSVESAAATIRTPASGASSDAGSGAGFSGAEVSASGRVGDSVLVVGFKTADEAPAGAGGVDSSR